MNASVIYSKELRFVYRLINSIQRDELLSKEEFKNYYDTLKQEVEGDNQKYIFTSAIKAYLREIENSGKYNNAILNQFANILMQVNANIGFDNVVLFKVLAENIVSYQNDITEANLRKVVNNVLEQINVDNLALKKFVLDKINEILRLNPEISPETGIQVVDMIEKLSEEYSENYYFLAEKGVMI